MAQQSATKLPDELAKLVEVAVSQSDARQDFGVGGSQRRAEVDAWLLELRKQPALNQARVIAQLRGKNDVMGQALSAMRQAAVAQLQVLEANRLVEASGKLQWVGWVLGVVGLLVALVQLFA